jgi:hypothetical protein
MSARGLGLRNRLLQPGDLLDAPGLRLERGGVDTLSLFATGTSLLNASVSCGWVNGGNRPEPSHIRGCRRLPLINAA